MQNKIDNSVEHIAAETPSRFSKVALAILNACPRLIRRARISIIMARVSRGRSAAALADQIIVSGSNFAASIVLVRGLGLSEFGKYSIAYAFLLYANVLQMSFVGSPMLSIAPLMTGKEKRQFVDGMLTIQMLASSLLFVTFATIGAASRIFTKFYSLPCILIFACCVGTFQLQDWLRRYYFLYNKGNLAIVSDVLSYFVQFVLLYVLWRIHHLTLLSTLVVMFVTSVAGTIMGPLTDHFHPAWGHLRETWAHSKSLSRDMLIANQVQWFGIQGVLLIGTSIVGSAAIGGLRATQYFAGPVNLVLNSIENVVPIRLAEELKVKGTAGAYKFIQRAILVGVVSLGLILVPLGLFGRPILGFLYGPAMEAFYLPMLLQLSAIVVWIAGRLWFYLYRGVRDTRALLRANALSAIVSLATVYFLGHLWQASGVVLASLLGQMSIVVYCMFHWLCYRHELLLRFLPSSPVKVEAFPSESKREEVGMVFDRRAEW
jgi:O-antigen/teichoic acid export membrane protein